MSVKGGPDIITENLQLYLDAGNPKSYSGDGSIWYDLSGNYNDASLYGAIITTIEATGAMIFDSSSKFAILPAIDTYSSSAIFTINANLRYINGNYGSIFTNHIDRTNIYISQFTSSSIPHWHIRSGGTPWESNSLTTLQGRNITASFFIRVNKQLDQAQYVIKMGGRDDIIQYSINSGIVNPGSSVTFDKNMIGGPVTGDAYPDFNIYSFMIYNKWLTDAEITSNFNAIKSRFGL